MKNLLISLIAILTLTSCDLLSANVEVSQNNKEYHEVILLEKDYYQDPNASDSYKQLKFEINGVEVLDKDVEVQFAMNSIPNYQYNDITVKCVNSNNIELGQTTVNVIRKTNSLIRLSCERPTSETLYVVATSEDFDKDTNIQDLIVIQYQKF